MARTYKDTRNLTPLPTPAKVEGIPIDADLIDIEKAAQELTEKYGRGFSASVLRRLIRQGELQEDVHYVRRGRYYKIYLKAVQQWVVRG